MKRFPQWILWWHQYNSSQTLLSLVDDQISNTNGVILTFAPDLKNRLEDEEIECEVLDCIK